MLALKGADRVANRAVIIPLVADVLKRRTREEWLSVLAKAGIPSSPVHSLGELVAHPHTAASGMVVRQGDFQSVASPLRASGERLAIRRSPPRLGEHSREILRELGRQDSEIDAMIADRIVGSDPSKNTPNVK